MDLTSAADAYKQSSVENAPPIKIVRLLYQGAMRYLDRASQEDPNDPSSKFSHFLGLTDAVVTELRLAIDHSIESEIPGNLERLYLFCEDELGAASLERSADRLPGVRRVLETLMDAWQRVEIGANQAA